MGTSPYDRFAAKELILRDELAIDRTILANERTVLSYARTALALAVTGAGAIKLLPPGVGLPLGTLLAAAGIAVATVGAIRYRKVHADISRCRKQSAEIAAEARSAGGDDRA